MYFFHVTRKQVIETKEIAKKIKLSLRLQALYQWLSAKNNWYDKIAMLNFYNISSYIELIYLMIFLLKWS